MHKPSRLGALALGGLFGLVLACQPPQTHTVTTVTGDPKVLPPASNLAVGPLPEKWRQLKLGEVHTLTRVRPAHSVMQLDIAGLLLHVLWPEHRTLHYAQIGTNSGVVYPKVLLDSLGSNPPQSICPQTGSAQKFQPISPYIIPQLERDAMGNLHVLVHAAGGEPGRRAALWMVYGRKKLGEDQWQWHCVQGSMLAHSPSMSVDAQGRPWIAYATQQTQKKNRDTLLTLLTPTNDGTAWATSTLSTPTPGRWELVALHNTPSGGLMLAAAEQYKHDNEPLPRLVVMHRPDGGQWIPVKMHWQMHNPFEAEGTVSFSTLFRDMRLQDAPEGDIHILLQQEMSEEYAWYETSVTRADRWTRVSPSGGCKNMVWDTSRIGRKYGACQRLSELRILEPDPEDPESTYEFDATYAALSYISESGPHRLMSTVIYDERGLLIDFKQGPKRAYILHQNPASELFLSMSVPP